MTDGSARHFADGCSNLAKSSRGRNKNFSNSFLYGLARPVQLRLVTNGYQKEKRK
jgi:hypothetical protein